MTEKVTIYMKSGNKIVCNVDYLNFKYSGENITSVEYKCSKAPAINHIDVTQIEAIITG